MIQLRPPQTRDYGNRLEIAPLLDVIFILLIFFAVSTTVVMHNGIKLQLPAAETVSEQKKGNILTIDRAQRVYINQKLISEQVISSKIADLVAKEKNIQVILKAHKSTPYDFVIRVLDDIRLGGCYDIVLEAKKQNNTN
jgi:biopolymer transport protein ExbD